MKAVLIILAFLGKAMSEDFQCYSCKDDNNLNYVPCGDMQPNLETCNIAVPTCVAVRLVKSNDQTEVWKGCTINGDISLFDKLAPVVSDVLEKAEVDLAVDGCLDFSIGESVKTGSSLCFCSTSECNGAIGLQVLGSLFVFSIFIQRFLA